MTSPIADGVNRLVTNELVGETYAVGIEDAVFGDDHRILERGAERVTGIPEFGHVAHEAERARARQLAAEQMRLDVERDFQREMGRSEDFNSP